MEEPDSKRLRDKKAKKIQEIYGYPEEIIPHYEKLVEFIDRKLEAERSSVYSNPSEEFLNLMQITEELCKSVYITKNYLENLRNKNIIRKGSLLDKLLKETV